jgi:cob(I)alamin adenosyltransferase
MKKSNVYTKQGDKGETSLVSGNRVSKGDHRIHIYGEVDELNSCLGLALSLMKEQSVLEEEYDFIQDIQSTLFDLGSNLACELEFREKYKLPQLSSTDIEEVEGQIDKLDASLPPLKNFILPGGSSVAAQFHIARTVCRRIERNLVSFSQHTPEEIPENSIEFINRLSDYLFVMARYVNLKLHIEEVIWKPR